MSKGETRDALAVALIEGAFEDPPWSTFLEQLRSATGAEFATLIFQPPGWPRDEALNLIAGPATAEAVQKNFRRHSYPDSLTRREWMEDGRPHTLAELIAHDRGAHAEFYRELTDELSIGAVLEMRVQEPGGIDAWLTVVRSGPDFPKAVAELFRHVAPLLRGMLRSYVTLEQERFAASLASEAVKRLQFGWIAIDRDLRVERADQFGEQTLAGSDILSRDSSGRLDLGKVQLRREFEQAVIKLTDEPHSRARAISLSADPWLDALLVPARSRPFSGFASASVIAYIHGDNWRSAERQSQLADLFSLTPKEAQLALSICRGRTIAETASDLGLTVESARTYSKSIFAKTGARGQPDLVRIVMGSVLALSPEE